MQAVKPMTKFVTGAKITGSGDNMAIITVCDGKGCKKKSPDEKGLYVANQWYEVTAVKRSNKSIYVDRSKNFIYCKECYKKLGIPA